MAVFPLSRRLLIGSLFLLPLVGGSACANEKPEEPEKQEKQEKQEKKTTGTLHLSEVHQDIYGFGGTQTYNGDPLADFSGREAVYKALFQELKLDIFRLRNYYDYPGQEERFDHITREFAQAGRRWSDPKIRGEKGPVRLLFTSWSPPARLKSNNLVSGRSDGTDKGLENATLKKDSAGRYVYGEFADWWLASLQHFKSLSGAYPDYITLQNEPDISVSYEGCRFIPGEGVDAASGFSFAGYAEALGAVSDRLSKALGAQAPKILGPENFTIRIDKGVNHVRPFADPTSVAGKGVLDRLFGVSFHLYGVEAETANPARFHASLDSLRETYRGAGVKKPFFETEFLEGNTLTSLAGMIHDTLVRGDASAYLVWILARSTQKPGYALVYFRPEDGTIERRERFYAVKHFSAFVGEGWHRIGADCDDPAVQLSAYRRQDSRELVAVLINPTDQERHIPLVLDGDQYKDATTAVYRSSEGEAGERWQELGPLTTGNVVTLPKRSVATVKFTRP